MNEIIAAGPGLSAWLILAGVLFSVGVYGVLSRRNLIAILCSVELMANAVNINLVAFSRFHGDTLGQAFALFGIALTVAEVGVGLAIVMLVYRQRQGIDIDDLHDLLG
ncbi:MAG: NADH-quinone oxidoreductase subunit NuoK [Oligoflexia bacterium]|nr:NADH-quinone oxidoreductase subunit NuoK [Oligoflexia bacterium]